VDFYIKQLSPDWTFTKGTFDIAVPEVGAEQPAAAGTIPAAHFERDTATVTVDTSLPRSRQSAEEATFDFSVTIDSRGIPGRPDC
jgi:hypothetical protein